VNFFPKPRIADFDFKEFQAIKSAKLDLKLENQPGIESYFRVKHGVGHPAFAHYMLNPCMNKADFFGDVEPAHIAKVASLPPFTKTTNAYASF